MKIEMVHSITLRILRMLQAEELRDCRKESLWTGKPKSQSMQHTDVHDSTNIRNSTRNNGLMYRGLFKIWSRWTEMEK